MGLTLLRRQRYDIEVGSIFRNAHVAGPSVEMDWVHIRFEPVYFECLRGWCTVAAAAL